MNRSTRLAATATAACLSLLTATATAGDLRLDGRKSVRKLMGTSVQVTITGAPGDPVMLFCGLDAGPTVFGNQKVPLGFTPPPVMIPLGAMPAGGSLTTSFDVPVSKSSHEAKVYMLALVGTDDYSNGACITVLDRNIEIAGNSLSLFPHFEYVRAFNRGSTVQCAIDPTRYPVVAGQTADVYVVASKTKAQWQADPSLTDVRGGPQTESFAATTIQANTFNLSGALPGPNEASGSGDTRIGVGYDVVIDLDRDGTFDDDDLCDGFHPSIAGFYVVRDTETGSTKGSGSGGPYAVREILYSGGSFLAEDTYFPTNIGSLGRLPLVVVSHGNGHNYQWYDHIGYHLASYGYVVMSHQNNTVPGSHTAAVSTLQNTDYILQNQGTIAGGVLNGHIDSDHITWIGHSRGGDGVARAYDRLFDGSFTPSNYNIDDVRIVSSIAPVDFGGFADSNPHDSIYHLWVAQADADVTGCASSPQVHWYHLHDRATQTRQSISLYGVGHGDYHDGGGSSVASGPNLIGRNQTHQIMRGYLLPLVEHYIKGDVPSRDFLWRQYEAFRPIGAPTGSSIHANLMFQDGPDSGKADIDDFQTRPLTFQSSSGALATQTVSALTEGSLDDANNDFTNSTSDVFNGFTNDAAGSFTANSDGIVFSYTNDAAVTYTYLPTRDFSSFVYLSFRAAQQTRHPLTTAVRGDLTFSVSLLDSQGNSATINIGSYGGGIEEPYQRGGCGSGTGWNSEFETIRIRLTDFLHNGDMLDLADVTSVVFNFGPSFGSSQGRLGLDEIELTTR
ncbi:MAG: hypothetical protein AAF628_04265 [Planctomycetota bacterium]